MSVKNNTFQFDLNGISEISNQVKEVSLSNMLEENIITDSQYNEMMKYSVIAAEESMLGSLWNKLWKKDKTVSKLFVVKVLGHKTETE